MIVRVWHGWATPEKADAYVDLVKSEVIPGIFGKNIPGLRQFEIFRRDKDDGKEVEFMTIMQFDSLEAVKAFVGEDYDAAYLPARVQAALERFDLRAQHYELKAKHTVQG